MKTLDDPISCKIAKKTQSILLKSIGSFFWFLHLLYVFVPEIYSAGCPIPMKETIMEEPPADIKGKVTPVSGMVSCNATDIDDSLEGKNNS